MSTSDYSKGIDETEELRASKLSQLAKAVAALDKAKTQNYRDAQSICPHLLDDHTADRLSVIVLVIQAPY